MDGGKRDDGGYNELTVLGVRISQEYFNLCTDTYGKPIVCCEARS